MPPQNQAQVLPLQPDSLARPRFEDRPPPADWQATQVFQNQPVASAAVPEQSFTPLPGERDGIAPHAGDYHAPQATTRRLMLPATDTATPVTTVAEAPSNGAAVTGLILAVLFAPLGFVLSVRAFARRKSKRTAVISSLGIATSLAGITVMLLSGLALASSLSTVSGHNLDVAHQTSLAENQNQLQAAFIKNGTYPTLAQLNDAQWRSKNMIGTTAAVLSPTATPTPLVSGLATAQAYAYTTTPTDCAGTTASPCKSFTLSAALSTGDQYSVN